MRGMGEEGEEGTDADVCVGVDMLVGLSRVLPEAFEGGTRYITQPRRHHAT